jgi:site-specific DNA recombinase
MEKAKVGIYVRVSTDEQAKEGFSVAAQLDKLKNYCSFEEMNVTNEYVEEGWSGKNMERPQLKRLIRDIENKKINTVVVVKLDRLTRSVKDLNHLLEVFEDYNIQFHSTNEKIDTTTPTGRFFVNVMGSIAQLERETIVERVKDGMAQMVREGKVPGSVIPYGYRLENLKYYVVEEEAKVVRNIYDWFLKGMSVNAIMNKLKGTPSPSGKLDWNRGTIRNILNNPLYLGKLVWGTITNEESHEAIIDETTFKRSSKLINERKERQPSDFWGKYPFSGIMRCGKCGSRMSGKLKHGRSKYSVVYYRCAESVVMKCDMKSVREDTLEKSFIDFLSFYVENETNLKDLLGHDDQLDKKQDSVLIEQDLRQIKKQISNLYSLFAKGTFNVENIEKQILPLEKREKELLEQLEDCLEEELPKLSVEEFKIKASNLILNFQHSNIEVKKEMLHDLFDKIILHEDKTLDVYTK